MRSALRAILLRGTIATSGPIRRSAAGTPAITCSLLLARTDRFALRGFSEGVPIGTSLLFATLGGRRSTASGRCERLHAASAYLLLVAADGGRKIQIGERSKLRKSKQFGASSAVMRDFCRPKADG